MERCVVFASSRPLVPIGLSAIWQASVRARRGQKPSQNQLGFEASWLDKLLFIHDICANRAGRGGYLVVDRLQAFMRQCVAEQVRNCAAMAGVPLHKRLCHAAPDCSLTVGQLTSQFFTNVSLYAPGLTPFFPQNPDGSLHFNTPACLELLRRRAVKRILKPEGDNP